MKLKSLSLFWTLKKQILTFASKKAAVESKIWAHKKYLMVDPMILEDRVVLKLALKYNRLKTHFFVRGNFSF